MSNFTSQAIKASFLKLLNKQPLNKISVKDIVEDCGINRNSFYYHYRDIPMLIEEMIVEFFDNLLEQYPSFTSLGELFRAGVTHLLENRQSMLHIYNSVKRDVFEEYLLKYCEYMVTSYIDTAFSEQEIDPADRRVVIRFIKCQLFGSYIEWLNSGMATEIAEDFWRMLTLCRDLPDEILRRSRETGA